MYVGRRPHDVARLLLILLALTAGVAWGQSGSTDFLDASIIGDSDLTHEEREWLGNHPNIVLGVDPAFAPYSVIDNHGRFAGMAATTLVEAISARLGVSFTIGPQRSWPDIIEAAKRREIDVIVTATRTAEREDYLAFTSPYLKTPLVIMTRNDDYTLRSRDGLKNRSVALVHGYVSTEKVLSEFPSIQPLMVKNPLEGLIAVATGQADAYVGAIGVNTTVANQYGISNLRIAALFDVDQAQNFGVRNDWPLLAGILDKTLAAIPEAEKEQIRRRWVPQSISVSVAGKPTDSQFP